MTQEQIISKVMDHTQELAAVKESLKSAHKRIDDNDNITSGIHKLAANVETLALQVKLLTESVETSISKVELGLKNQGERIGSLESKSGKRWEALITQVISLAVAALIGGAISKVL